MAIWFFSGFETGDTSEWPTLSGSPVIDTAHVTRGGYSLKATGGTTTYVESITGLNLSTCYVRFWAYSTMTGAATKLMHLVDIRNSSDVTILAIIGQIDGAGNPIQFGTSNFASGGFQSINTSTISNNVLHLIEVKLVISATVGVVELKVDGTIVGTQTGQNTGSANVDRISVGNSSDNGITGSVWIDDVMVRDDQYPGPGYCIARQGVAGTPTYDAWTKNGAATSALCWSNTPFTTGTNCTNIGLNNAQTMFVGSFTKTGSAAEGVGIINSIDTINAAKTAFIAKATVAGNISIRRRVGGANTDTVKAVTTSDAYYDDGIWTPAFANLTDGTTEIGAVDDVAGVTDTVEDMWLIVDFTPHDNSYHFDIWNRISIATNQVAYANNNFVPAIFQYLMYKQFPSGIEIVKENNTYIPQVQRDTLTIMAYKDAELKTKTIPSALYQKYATGTEIVKENNTYIGQLQNDTNIVQAYKLGDPKTNLIQVFLYQKVPTGTEIVTENNTYMPQVQRNVLTSAAFNTTSLLGSIYETLWSEIPTGLEIVKENNTYNPQRFEIPVYGFVRSGLLTNVIQNVLYQKVPTGSEIVKEDNTYLPLVQRSILASKTFNATSLISAIYETLWSEIPNGLEIVRENNTYIRQLTDEAAQTYKQADLKTNILQFLLYQKVPTGTEIVQENTPYIAQHFEIPVQANKEAYPQSRFQTLLYNSVPFIIPPPTGTPGNVDFWNKIATLAGFSTKPVILSTLLYQPTGTEIVREDNTYSPQKFETAIQAFKQSDLKTIQLQNLLFKTFPAGNEIIIVVPTFMPQNFEIPVQAFKQGDPKTNVIQSLLYQKIPTGLEIVKEDNTYTPQRFEQVVHAFKQNEAQVKAVLESFVLRNYPFIGLPVVPVFTSSSFLFNAASTAFNKDMAQRIAAEIFNYLIGNGFSGTFIVPPAVVYNILLSLALPALGINITSTQEPLDVELGLVSEPLSINLQSVVSAN